MANQPNPPDPDDAITERAVDMGRPSAAQAGAGRAINAAFSRRRPEDATAPQAETTGQQDLRIEGAGYPSEDRDDVDPVAPEEDEDGYRDDDNDPDTFDEDEDDDGYRRGSDAPGLETGDGQLQEMMPDSDSFPVAGGGAADRSGDAPGLETGDGQLEELMVPPGGDALGGDRDTDPNLNGGHGIRMNAPEEGEVPIEDEDTDGSIIGHGHEDKAAWNRERVAHLQDLENDERDLRDATSESAGVGGAVLAGALEGWEGGDASTVVAQGVDDEFDPELSEEEEIAGDMTIEGMAGDILADDSIIDPNNTPFLPEHRDLPDDNLSLEEKLIATPGEDPLSAGAEVGVNEEMEAEDLNQTDSISRLYEDTREFLDDAMAGNERKGGVEDD
ncbi:hypothetical protein [Rubellimicrobium arenae]|uniref:hypothetical protein n=1 Tax=Rubellimicrobium arenae TaxID=2817372 RepID=UPI001B30E1D9|nr:hypothetical protein [Rubellimicrobium arenae]